MALNKKFDDICINTIRMLAVDAVEKANSGHPGTPMGCAALAYVLWTQFLRHNPKNPGWPNRDRFVLSAGHASMLLYSLLHLTGYDLTLDDIKCFRQWDSKTPGHPEYKFAPGVELTTGPLGQGFGAGVGMAIAERYLAGYFNRPGYDIIAYNIYALCSDGDIMEGVSSEAASLAGHLGLGKLIYIYDDNRITIDGSTSLALSENVGERFQAYGWHVQHADGNSTDEVAQAISKAKNETERPSLIITSTHIGYGSPEKQDTAASHGAPLGKEEVVRTKKNLGWPLEPSFYVPDEALKHFRQAVAAGEKMEMEWQAKFKAYAREYPDLAHEWEVYSKGKLPEGWDADIPVFDTENGSLATRQASGKVLKAIAKKFPMIIGGSADLAESTGVKIEGLADFQKTNFSGRNLRFGVREHAMGAVLNGLALSQFIIPYGSTFLIFSDYMRPAIRIAALSGLHVIYVFSHDSIALGEDGPTHQPVEHLASLRAIPNLKVMRPSDAGETAVAWVAALEQRDGPVAMILTRQKVPVIDRKKYASASGLLKGAYVLADAKSGAATPEIILIATGSEVCITLAAHEKLCELNIASRVVSMPCWELFEAQPKTYQDEVLPPGATVRLAVEAASPFGWERYTGAGGKIMGITRFGVSAPGEVVMEKFGFTADNVVKHATQLLKEKKEVKKYDYESIA